MLHFIRIVVLSLVAGTAWCGTFEITDPAAQFFEEAEEQVVEAGELESESVAHLRCTVDLGTGACQCADKESGLDVRIDPPRCAGLVRDALNRKDAR